MKYDIAAKVVIDIAKEAILRRFLDMDIDNVQLIDNLPEETVSLKRSDFPLQVVLKDGKKIIILIEIQTRFNKNFILRLIDYTIRFMLKYRLKVRPLVLLLTPSRKATGFYKDEIFTFNYQVVRFWELNAKKYMDEINLYPFVPIMSGGEDFLEEAEKRIYENSEISEENKADLLTAMAIFAGLKDRNLALQLIERRRDIMIQSAAYEIIKEDGRKEGLQEGLEKGLEKGLKKGLYDAISFGLELKFGDKGINLMKKVTKVKSVEKLELIKNTIRTNDKLEDIEKLI